MVYFSWSRLALLVSLYRESVGNGDTKVKSSTGFLRSSNSAENYQKSSLEKSVFLPLSTSIEEAVPTNNFIHISTQTQSITKYSTTTRTTGSLKGFIYINNGYQQTEKAILPGVTIYLQDKSGRTIKKTESISTGEWSMNDVAVGEYTLSFDAPSGFTLTGYSKNEVKVIVAPEKKTVLPNDFKFIRTESIGSVMGFLSWVNNNLADFTVKISDLTGRLIASTVIDATGKFEFANLPPAAYILHLDIDSHNSASEIINSRDFRVTVNSNQVSLINIQITDEENITSIQITTSAVWEGSKEIGMPDSYTIDVYDAKGNGLVECDCV